MNHSGLRLHKHPRGNMDITTQLGGVYRPNNHALFAVKKKLQALGVRVTHPISYDFIIKDNQPFTFDPNVWSQYEVALDYYQSIATCDFHVVCNQKAGTSQGYMGADTARSLVYALLKHKPVILLFHPTFASDVNPLEAGIIERNIPAIKIENILHHTNDQLRRTIATTCKMHPQYQFEDNEINAVHDRVQTYLAATLAMPPISV